MLDNCITDCSQTLICDAQAPIGCIQTPRLGGSPASFRAVNEFHPLPPQVIRGFCPYLRRLFGKLVNDTILPESMSYMHIHAHVHVHVLHVHNGRLSSAPKCACGAFLRGCCSCRRKPYPDPDPPSALTPCGGLDLFHVYVHGALTSTA